MIPNSLYWYKKISNSYWYKKISKSPYFKSPYSKCFALKVTKILLSSLFDGGSFMLISLFISAIIALGRSIAYCASAGDENERIRLLSSLLTDRQKIDTIIEDLEFNEEKTTQDLIDSKNNTVAMCKTLVHSTLPRIIETAARQDGSNEEQRTLLSSAAETKNKLIELLEGPLSEQTEVNKTQLLEVIQPIPENLRNTQSAFECFFGIEGASTDSDTITDEESAAEPTDID